VVVQVAEQLNLNPYPIMMGMILAASAAFMTPFSHKANLLVMGAGAGIALPTIYALGRP
jgi:di/tricarboxylate transporter